MRIVIVEDESAIREGLTHMIEKNTPHTVVGNCKNGIEGIELILKRKPDLVITDIRMNGMDGLEMLNRLKELGAEVYSIIISGYSEFEYARQAISLGVQDYLLKPISVDALRESLKRIAEKLNETQSMTVKQPENYVREYFFGTGEEQEEAKEKLYHIFPEEKQKKYGIFAGYLKNIKEDESEIMERPLRNLKRQFSNISYLEACEERTYFRILILKAEKEELEAFTEAFQNVLENDGQLKKLDIPWGMDFCDRIEEWRDVFHSIQKALSYCLRKGCGVLRYAGQYQQFSKKELSYPIQTEKKLLKALGDGDADKTKELIEEFLYLILQDDHDPKDIRHAVLKLMTGILDTAREINRKAYEILREKDYMKNVLQAYTAMELRELLQESGELVCEREQKKGIGNYTINRTLEYIRMHYKEGITLEETAETLNITPEYLSSLFKREMGMNFSVFLKKFRISHAKRLLKGTDMKIYEIAEACGYSNSNYFTKVFKEETGVSPAEYR